MKKLALILCLCLTGATLAQAQITTGESTSPVVRTGNRAEQGDFGLYLGATTTMFKHIGSSTELSALPLINLKYMVTDRVEARLGIEWWKTSDSKDYDAYKTVEKETSMMFYPGIAYHFNRSNLLDVYVGGELPIGWGSNGNKTEYSEGDYEDQDLVGNNFNIGLGAFIGLQAYICNLPLAIGVEYGVSLKYCHAGDGILSKDGMSVEQPMEDVSNNKFNLGNQARLTLTYFFKL